MTALRFQTGVGHQTSQVSLWGEMNYTWTESSSQLSAVFSLLAYFKEGRTLLITVK